MTRMTDYQRDLVEEHMHIVDRVIGKHFDVKGGAYMSFEDLYQTGCEALCRAAMQYQPARGAFYALAYKCVYNALIDYCRKVNTSFRKVSVKGIWELEQSCEGHTSFMANVIRANTLMFLGEYAERYGGIAQKGIEAMIMKQCGCTRREVAEHFGTTGNNVNAWISRARAKLRKEKEMQILRD